MSDLTEFLLARIAEDEAVAQRAGAAGIKSAVHDSLVCRADDVVYIARWVPARVLAECEAKRRIVERLAVMQDEMGWDGIDDQFLALLALPYADHPDYDQAWRP